MFDEKHHHTGKDFFEQELKKPDYLIGDFLARQSLTNLTGPPGGGKTILSLYAVVNNINKCFLDKESVPFRTLFIDEENGAWQTQYIFKMICRHVFDALTETEKETVMNNVDFYCMDGFRLDTKWGNELNRLLLRMKAAKRLPDLIIIDNISRIFEGDSNTQGDAKLVHRIFKTIAIRFNVAILLISHTRKGNPNTLQDISGSGDFGAQVTISYISKRIGSDNNPKYWLKKVKNNIGVPTSPAIVYDIHGYGDSLEIKYEGIHSDLYNNSKSGAIEKSLQTIMKSGEVLSRNAIIAALKDKDFKEGTIIKHLFDKPSIDGFKKTERGKYQYEY